MLNKSLSPKLTIYFNDLAVLNEKFLKEIEEFRISLIRKQNEEMAQFVRERNEAFKKVELFQRKNRLLFRDNYKKASDQSIIGKYERHIKQLDEK
jgi:hypothetical protein